MQTDMFPERGLPIWHTMAFLLRLDAITMLTYVDSTFEEDNTPYT